MKKEFNIDEYIKKYDIDKVLFIGNAGFYISDEFMLNVMEVK